MASTSRVRGRRKIVITSSEKGGREKILKVEVSREQKKKGISNGLRVLTTLE